MFALMEPKGKNCSVLMTHSRMLSWRNLKCAGGHHHIPRVGLQTIHHGQLLLRGIGMDLLAPLCVFRFVRNHMTINIEPRMLLIGDVSVGVVMMNRGIRRSDHCRSSLRVKGIPQQLLRGSAQDCSQERERECEWRREGGSVAIYTSCARSLVPFPSRGGCPAVPTHNETQLISMRSDMQTAMGEMADATRCEAQMLC